MNPPRFLSRPVINYGGVKFRFYSAPDFLHLKRYSQDKPLPVTQIFHKGQIVNKENGVCIMFTDIDFGPNLYTLKGKKNNPALTKAGCNV
jgi:hypothetical protein